MEQKSPDKVCYQFICPRYPKCARARGRGCCIEYPEDEAQMVQEGGLQGRGWISAVCGGAVGVSIFMTHSTKIFVFI